MNKHEIFSIIQQSLTNPPVFFPETIVVGFKFKTPNYISYSEEKIDFLPINSSDAKLIGVYWKSDLSPILTIKGQEKQFNTSDISLINLSIKNVIFQKFIHHEISNRFRVIWSKGRRLKLLTWNKVGSKTIHFKSSGLSSDHLKKFSQQLEYLTKLLKKHLHLTYSSDLASLSVDFILSPQILCLGIRNFTVKPIFALTRNLSSTFQHSLQPQLKDFSSNSIKLKKSNSNLSLQKKVYISNLRNLTRKMRLIISADKPKAQLIEGIQSNVESILNTSQIE
jgi:hypothetical protein